MVRVCHGICERLKKTDIKRPIYLYQRRCSKCEVFYDEDVFICPCCKCQTKGRPYSSKNNEKYVEMRKELNMTMTIP